MNRLFTFLIDNNIAGAESDKRTSADQSKKSNVREIISPKDDRAGDPNLRKVDPQASNSYQKYEASDEEDEDRNFKHIRRLQKDPGATSQAYYGDIPKTSEEHDAGQKNYPDQKTSRHSGSSSVSHSSPPPGSGAETPQFVEQPSPGHSPHTQINARSNSQAPYSQSQNLHSRRRIARGVKRSSYAPKGDKRPKKMCSDYENRGYCTLGDSCPDSHNDNYIVIDGVSPQQFFQFFNARRPQIPQGTNKYQPRLNSSDAGIPSAPNFQDTWSGTDDQRTFKPHYTDTVDQNASILKNMPYKSAEHAKDNPGLPTIRDPPDNLATFSESAPEPLRDEKDTRQHYQTENMSKFQNENKLHPGGRDILFISNIPPEFFSIETINQYFKRFGTVINVSLKPNSRALVQFSSPQEAYKAHCCPNPVFNNRFVRVNFAKHEYGSRHLNYQPYSKPSLYANLAGGNRSMVAHPNSLSSPNTKQSPNAPPGDLKGSNSTLKPRSDIAAEQTEDGKNKSDASLAAGKIAEIQKTLIQKYIREQDLILAKMKSSSISDSDKEILLEQFEKLSSLSRALIKTNSSSTKAGYSSTQTQNNQQPGNRDISSLNAIRDSRQSVESEIKKLKAQIGSGGSEQPTLDTRKVSKDYDRYFAGNKSAPECSPVKQGINQKFWGAMLKVESKRPLPLELIQLEYTVGS